LRLISWSFQDNDGEEDLSIFTEKYDAENPVNFGKYVKADLDMLIESIYLPPSPMPGLAEIVKTQLKVFRLNKDVFLSGLDAQPF